MTPLSVRPDGLLVALRVQPGARRTGVEGLQAGPEGVALKVKVTAPALEGRANEAVIALLAEAWGLPRASLTIRRGEASRHKLLHVAGDPDRLLPLLEARLPRS